MPDYEVHIILTGILALVPGDASANYYRVVIPNNTNNPLHSHRPHILADNVWTSGRLPNSTDTHPVTQRELGIWNLAGHEITIDTMPTGKPIFVPDYVISMTDVAGDIPADTILPDLLSTNDADLVGGRMMLTGGTVEATYVRGDVLWIFVPTTGPKYGPKHVAQEVCFHYTQASNKIRLNMARQGADFHLDVTGNPRTYQIEVRIGSLPGEQIVTHATEGKPEKRDEHFNLHHDMAAAKGHKRCIPVSSQLGNPDTSMPQETHKHSLNMVSTLPDQLAQISGREVASRTEPPSGPIRGAGGANCPPTIWKG